MTVDDSNSRLEQWRKLNQSRNRLTSEGYICFLKANYFTILLGLTGGYLVASALGVFGWGHIPEQPLTPAFVRAASDPCEKKERCVIAYVAPWCGSCASAAGFLNSTKNRINRSQHAGMKIIAGMDSEANLKEMASKFDGGVFMDVDGNFARSIGIHAVPSVLVVAKDGEILNKGLPGMLSGVGSEDENIEYYISSLLNLGEFVPPK